MLTELFIADFAPRTELAAELRGRAISFGEGLQLVNVLNDLQDDRQDGRNFVPSGVSVTQLIEVSRKDLEQAMQYVGVLQASDAPAGVVQFVEIPVRLAFENLQLLEGVTGRRRLTRSDVQRIVEQVQFASVR